MSRRANAEQTSKSEVVRLPFQCCAQGANVVRLNWAMPGGCVMQIGHKMDDIADYEVAAAATGNTQE